MRFNDTLENLLAQKSKVKILRFLLKSRLEITGREIARVINMDHKTCHRSLKELSQQGVVLLNHSGGGILYKLNDKNLLVKKLLIPLFEREKNLPQIISNSLVKRIKIPIVSIILFGSITTEKERATSDVDLLIIVSNKSRKEAVQNKLSQVEYDFICKFGNMLSPMILTQEELQKKLVKKDKLIIGILRTGRSILGKSTEELIKSNAQKHFA